MDLEDKSVRWWDSKRRVMVRKWSMNLVRLEGTGTPDRHGEEIYDRDIVAIPERGEVYEVRFGWCGDADKYAMGVFRPNQNLGSRIDRIGQVTEIIGNMFETPHLFSKRGYPLNPQIPQKRSWWQRIKAKLKW